MRAGADARVLAALKDERLRQLVREVAAHPPSSSKQLEPHPQKEYSFLGNCSGFTECAPPALSLRLPQLYQETRYLSQLLFGDRVRDSEEGDLTFLKEHTQLGSPTIPPAPSTEENHLLQVPCLIVAVVFRRPVEQTRELQQKDDLLPL